LIDRTLYDWAPIVVFIPSVAFLVDFYLTLAGARAYKLVSDRWSVEGSYELNDPWIASVEADRMTIRVAFAAGILLVLMLVTWLLTSAVVLNPRLPDRYAYSLFAGVVGLLFLGVQLPILFAHATNLVRLHLLADPLATSGRTVSARWASHLQHSANYLVFGILWASLFVLSLQVFFAGGVLGTMARAIVHYRTANRLRAGQTTDAEHPNAPADGPSSDRP
jgi:hypothetical protein